VFKFGHDYLLEILLHLFLTMYFAGVRYKKGALWNEDCVRVDININFRTLDHININMVISLELFSLISLRPLIWLTITFYWISFTLLV